MREVSQRWMAPGGNGYRGTAGGLSFLQEKALRRARQQAMPGPPRQPLPLPPRRRLQQQRQQQQPSRRRQLRGGDLLSARLRRRGSSQLHLALHQSEQSQQMSGEDRNGSVLRRRSLPSRPSTLTILSTRRATQRHAPSVPPGPPTTPGASVQQAPRRLGQPRAAIDVARQTSVPAAGRADGAPRAAAQHCAADAGLESVSLCAAGHRASRHGPRAATRATAPRARSRGEHRAISRG